VQFRVWISLDVERALDATLGFDLSSQVIADLIRLLRESRVEDRRHRDGRDAQAFHHFNLVPLAGRAVTLDFTVMDGWEVDRLHVVGVRFIDGDEVP
jgi:hypothetical protein